MVRAVQATLLHRNSSDERPRHHLRPTGENSWCKWQCAQALGIKYSHSKPPIPEAIVHLLKPIYACLGSSLLLQKCLEGYTQMPTRHYTQLYGSYVSPKELFLGKEVWTSPAPSLFKFSDGACAPTGLNSPFCRKLLRPRDKLHISKSKYKASEHGKAVRKEGEKKAKGNQR